MGTPVRYARGSSGVLDSKNAAISPASEWCLVEGVRGGRGGGDRSLAIVVGYFTAGEQIDMCTGF